MAGAHICVHSAQKPNNIVQFIPAKETKLLFLLPLEVMAKFNVGLLSAAPLKWMATNNAVVIHT